MSDNPHIKREVLEYVYREADGPCDVVHLNHSPLADEYGTRRLARKASETGVLTCGINMVHPWYLDEQEIREKIEEYGGDPDDLA